MTELTPAARTLLPLLATYRLQLGPGFGFDEAAALVPYLARLGVTHVYLSPILQAVPGSTHGYDVVDHGHISDDLGGADGLARLRAMLDEHGLGLVVDTVPNHMAIGAGRANQAWWEVLENGRAALTAPYFDVDWDVGERRGRNRVLLPILGDRYGRVLEAGDLRVVRRGRDFEVRYFEHAVPLAPKSLEVILGAAAERSGSSELGFLADAVRALPPSTAALDGPARRRRHRDKEVIRARIAALCEADERVARAVDARVAEINAHPDELDALLERQHYRLTYWRAGGTDLDYRRFFDVTTLAGLRVEDEEVFAATHELLLALLRDGTVQGLRIDHPDGLADPEQYIRRLHEQADGPWIVVEKILGPGERLPSSWLADGTTGYDFCERVTGLFVEPATELLFTDFYTGFTGRTPDVEQEIEWAYAEVMRTVLASEVERVVAAALAACTTDRRWRDATRHEVQTAVRALVSGFHVYRTYARPGSESVRDADRDLVAAVVERAIERRPELDAELVRFLGAMLILQVSGPEASDFVVRFQQLTGPVRAKAVEDTTFYRYTRFIARNEVGSEPSVWSVTPDAFHAHNAAMAARWPRTMLTTATHDTKRGEDVRARLVVLSELAEEWTMAVDRWSARAATYRTGGQPDRGLEYLWWQTLVGAYPISEERAVAYVLKAAKEAKEATSWTAPDPAYEDAVVRFVSGVLADDELMADVADVVARIEPAARTTSLAVTLLKLTSPGVPDTYQGTELWEHSLVDPDNRRAVDFVTRAELLDQARSATPEELLARADEGLPKLALIAAALWARRGHPDAFVRGGSYEPLVSSGEHAAKVLAFARGGEVVTVVPRLVAALDGWSDTKVALPSGRWRNLVTGELVDGGEVGVAELLARFPVALLERSASR